jgi:hypothetical protein
MFSSCRPAVLPNFSIKSCIVEYLNDQSCFRPNVQYINQDNIRTVHDAETQLEEILFVGHDIAARV